MHSHETRIDAIAVLTLDRPQALDAISEQMIGEIERFLARHAESDAAALIVTGAGRAFCAGADLKQLPPDPGARMRRMHALSLSLVEHPKLSIAAVNGLALGGGMELALACTLRVAHPEADLGLPEARIALLPGYGGPQLLLRTVGAARALPMLLTGDPVRGEEARAMGLVTALASNTLAEAVALAERCAAHGQAVQHVARRLLREGAELPLREALALDEALLLPLARSREAKAAIHRFTRAERHRLPR